MPLANNSIQHIFSNLTLQWCSCLSTLLSEFYRVLVNGGTCAFTTLGPATLYELKQAWAVVDDVVHVNTFARREDWQAAINHSGFTMASFHQQKTVIPYSSVSALLRELKYLGASNSNAGRRKTLTGRGRLQALINAYGAYKKDDLYPASYEVYCWVLSK